ncbi:hypothetical protein BH10ACI1_BH10ACI1_33820 [soil metagenome]
MNFTFEVGNQEKHLITFNFNQFWGNLKITVDNEDIIKNIHLLSLSLIRQYRFNVGETERHNVLIEKERKLFFAGFRKQKYRVFVDGKLFNEYEGF